GGRMEMPPRWVEPAPQREPLVQGRSRPFPPHSGLVIRVLRAAAALLLRVWMRVYHRFSIVGRDNLPRDQSFILVANHTSHLDALCLLASLPLGKLHRAFPAAARDYFFVSVPGQLAATVIANALPFDRHSDIRESLARCRELLEQRGNVLVIFPEGTRS